MLLISQKSKSAIILQIFFIKDKDPIVEKLYESTEEGQKVTRNKGDKFLAVFKRIPDPFENKIS